MYRYKHLHFQYKQYCDFWKCSKIEVFRLIEDLAVTQLIVKTLASLEGPEKMKERKYCYLMSKTKSLITAVKMLKYGCKYLDDI